MSMLRAAIRRHPLLATHAGRITLLFAIEGVLLQYITSINGFGNNL